MIPTQMKLYIYGAIIVAILAAMGYAINEFHYAPISALQKSNSTKDKFITDTAKKHAALIKVYETNFNEMYGKLFMCEQNSTKNKLEGIIEGLGGDDEADVVIDFSNITY